MSIAVRKKYKHNSEKVKAGDLLEIGLDPAVVWGVDRDREIDSSVFIVAALINGYNEHIVMKLCEYFGKGMILQSLKQYRNRVSDKLFKAVKKYLEQPIPVIS